MAPTPYWLFIGNYNQSAPRGIYVSRFDPSSASLTPPRFAVPSEDPNFLILHPALPVLYAVGPAQSGTVEAFTIDISTGNLTLLNRQPSGGDNPAHLAIDPAGKLLVVANYDGATVAAFPLAPDGRIQSASAIHKHTGSGPHPDRQTKPYPHGVTFDASGKYLLVSDLGADKIFVYLVDSALGTLTPHPSGDATLPPGSGPRHLVSLSGRSSRFAYVINELTSTITAFSFSPAGELREIQSLAPWPPSPPPNTGAEISLHPNGRYLYASNRGYDSIAICSIDDLSGKLAHIGHQFTRGKAPRHFALDPSGQFLIAANFRSNSLSLFGVNSSNGGLSVAGPVIPAAAPVCVAFVSARP